MKLPALVNPRGMHYAIDLINHRLECIVDACRSEYIFCFHNVRKSLSMYRVSAEILAEKCSTNYSTRRNQDLANLWRGTGPSIKCVFRHLSKHCDSGVLCTLVHKHIDISRNHYYSMYSYYLAKRFRTSINGTNRVELPADSLDPIFRPKTHLL